MTLQFLRSICPNHLMEEIEGDLLQQFSRDALMLVKERRTEDYYGM